MLIHLGSMSAHHTALARDSEIVTAMTDAEYRQFRADLAAVDEHTKRDWGVRLTSLFLSISRPNSPRYLATALISSRVRA